MKNLTKIIGLTIAGSLVVAGSYLVAATAEVTRTETFHAIALSNNEAYQVIFDHLRQVAQAQDAQFQADEAKVKEALCSKPNALPLQICEGGR